jgi:hypothetical protein
VALSNNKMKLTKPAKARLARSSQLILVFDRRSATCRRVLTCLLVLATILPSAHGLGADPVRHSRKTLDLLEAATRWALRSGTDHQAKQVFLAVDLEDPPAALLMRLKDVARLRPVSECTCWRTPVGQTPDGAVVVMLSRMSIGSKGQASLWIWHHHGPTSGAGCEEHFEQRGGRWVHRPIKSGETMACGLA